MAVRTTPEQHSLGRSVALHLLPGAATVGVFYLLVPVVDGLGFPPIFAFLLALPLVLFPFELGYLLYQARKRTGTMSLAPVVDYRERLPRRSYIVWVPALVIWAFALSIVWAPIQPAFRDELFGFLPEWVRQPFGFEDPGRYPSGALVTTAVLFVAFNGIIGPTIEELYFRGHLLPRIDRFGAWAPVLNSGLFTLYHFWSPWQLPVRLLQTLPFIYLVWRKRSIYLGIVVHCLLNTIGAVGVVPRMLAGA
jgi:membrane protease YdiL (CAAX protease family)